MTFVLMLAALWLVANVALVLMLRRNARVRERDPGHAPGVAISRTPGFSRSPGRL